MQIKISIFSHLKCDISDLTKTRPFIEIEKMSENNTDCFKWHHDNQ